MSSIPSPALARLLQSNYLSNDIMTLGNLISTRISRLAPKYGEGEARWMLRTMLEHLKGWDRVELAVRSGDEVSDFVAGKVDGIVGRLLDDEPLQYILGETYWHGMTLKVTPDVLIPRPETSELVDMISDRNSGSDLAVLDLCTGSGCIAVALASALPFSRVSAMDISEAALKVARENSALRRVRVEFTKGDVLSALPYADGEFDIIVSNPPYIAEEEKKEMDRNVLDHEPHLALFVPDDEPLRFYTPIAREGLRVAKPGAQLWFEINPRFSSEVSAMMAGEGWEDVDILPDSNGRKRFAYGRKG